MAGSKADLVAQDQHGQATVILGHVDRFEITVEHRGNRYQVALDDRLDALSIEVLNCEDHAEHLLDHIIAEEIVEAEVVVVGGGAHRPEP